MRYIFIVSALFFVPGLVLSGQINNDSIPKNGNVSLNIKSISFVKNNEYFNPVIEGYTLIGSFIRPELVYSPSEKISLRAGVHMLKYSGAGKFSQIKPVFSTTFNLSNSTFLTLGSLSGSNNHLLFDPHFDSEKLYNDYAEDGFELVTRTNNFFNNTWINWENFIFKGDTTREIFTYGESFRYSSPKISDFIGIEIPFQIQLKHFGGQISNYPEHVETLLNMSTGVRMNFDIAEKKAGQIGLEYLLFVNNEINGGENEEITHGHANWIKLHYTYKAFYTGMAYWKSYNFYSPNGNPIYSSKSDFQDNVVVPDREIITNYFYLTILPESYMELFLGLETYYYPDQKRLDNAITLHLNFDKMIRLATLKH
jgi:hypothetical protein